MIGKLTGKVDAIGESHLIIDVGGVGYEVQASSRALRNLKHGDTAALTIDTHVREDAAFTDHDTIFGHVRGEVDFAGQFADHGAWSLRGESSLAQ